MDSKSAFCTTLKLLGYPSSNKQQSSSSHANTNPSLLLLNFIIQPNMFTTTTQGPKIMESILWFLFSKLDYELCLQNFHGCWPIIDRIQAREFRNHAFKWLEKLKKDGKLPSDVLIRRSFLDECRVERFEKMIHALAELALKETLKRDYQIEISQILECHSDPKSLRSSLMENNLLEAEKFQKKIQEIAILESEVVMMKSILDSEYESLSQFEKTLDSKMKTLKDLSLVELSATVREYQECCENIQTMINDIDIQNEIAEKINLNKLDIITLRHVPIQLPEEYALDIRTRMIKERQPLYFDKKLNLLGLIYVFKWMNGKLDDILSTASHENLSNSREIYEKSMENIKSVDSQIADLMKTIAENHSESKENCEVLKDKIKIKNSKTSNSKLIQDTPVQSQKIQKRASISSMFTNMKKSGGGYASRIKHTTPEAIESLKSRMRQLLKTPITTTINDSLRKGHNSLNASTSKINSSKKQLNLNDSWEKNDQETQINLIGAQIASMIESQSENEIHSPVPKETKKKDFRKHQMLLSPAPQKVVTRIPTLDRTPQKFNQSGFIPKKEIPRTPLGGPGHVEKRLQQRRERNSSESKTELVCLSKMKLPTTPGTIINPSTPVLGSNKQVKSSLLDSVLKRSIYKDISTHNSMIVSPLKDINKTMDVSPLNIRSRLRQPSKKKQVAFGEDSIIEFGASSPIHYQHSQQTDSSVYDRNQLDDVSITNSNLSSILSMDRTSRDQVKKRKKSSPSWVDDLLSVSLLKDEDMKLLKTEDLQSVQQEKILSTPSQSKARTDFISPYSESKKSYLFGDMTIDNMSIIQARVGVDYGKSYDFNDSLAYLPEESVQLDEMTKNENILEEYDQQEEDQENEKHNHHLDLQMSMSIQLDEYTRKSIQMHEKPSSSMRMDQSIQLDEWTTTRTTASVFGEHEDYDSMDMSPSELNPRSMAFSIQLDEPSGLNGVTRYYDAVEESIQII